jgi:hypothetical protein
MNLRSYIWGKLKGECTQVMKATAAKSGQGFYELYPPDLSTMIISCSKT